MNNKKFQDASDEEIAQFHKFIEDTIRKNYKEEIGHPKNYKEEIGHPKNYEEEIGHPKNYKEEIGHPKREIPDPPDINDILNKQEKFIPKLNPIKSFQNPEEIFNNERVQAQEKQQIKRERITVVNIDSRDRDTTIYPYANSFEILLERSFQNIKRVSLLTTEFPNTDQTVKSTPTSLKNNKVYWINQSNVEQEYSIDLTSGNYTGSTLTDEVVKKTNQVINVDLGKKHFFDVDINLDTSIVDIRQLNMKPLKNNPIYIIESNNTVTVSQINSTVETGDTVYLSGVRGFIGGISPEDFNNYHTVTNTTSILITDLNNIIDFTETSVSSTPKAAIIEKTLYNTPSDLATAVETALDQAGVNTYTVSFASNKFTVNSSSTFTIDFSSGGNLSISAGEVLGFDISSDTTNATSAVSDTDIPVSSWQFELDVEGVFTSRGGSNGVRTGTLVPFMFNFGSNTDTISDVLGYPDEDTSNSISTMTLSTFTGLISSSSILTGPPRSVNIYSVAHGLLTGDKVKLFDFVTEPPISSNNDITYGQISNVFTIEKVDDNNFKFSFSNISRINFTVGTPRWGSAKIQVSHTSHGLSTGDIIRLYRAPTKLGGVLAKDINNLPFTITVEDANTYYFSLNGSFASSTETSTTTGLRLSAKNKSSTLYGFSGIQDNTSDDGTTLNKQINLGGEDYIFLTSPQLSNFNNSNQLVRNIFAKILLTGVPGTRLYNTFASNPKTFDQTPLNELYKIKFELRRQDNILFDLLNLNFSISLEIIEIIDEAMDTNYNARRGIREIIDRVR